MYEGAIERLQVHPFFASLARPTPVRTPPPPYEFRGAGAPRQYIRRIPSTPARGLGEIKALIGGLGTVADLLAGEIVELEVKLASEDLEQASEDKADVEANRDK
jgi:hypothetical protein